MRFSHAFQKWLELSEMYPFLEGINTEYKDKKKRKLILYQSISRGQSGGLPGAPAHQSVNVREEIQGIALNSGSAHSHLSRKKILISRLFGADTDLTPCQLVRHQRAPALGLH